MKARKKALAFGIASLAISVLGLAVFSCRTWAVESWNIWRLGSDAVAERDAAFRNLVERKSLRAFPYLLELGKAEKVQPLAVF